MKRWICLSIIAAFLSALIPVRGTGMIIVDEAYWHQFPHPPEIIPPPYPWPPPPSVRPRPHVFSPLELRSTHIHSRIKDQIAVTKIEQEFYNPNASRLEGNFVFPVPKGAQLDGFTMDIDGADVEAELLSADKARDIYEGIVRKSKDPALLEYADRDVFKVRIFPIEPRGKKRITVRYTQLLKSDSGLIGYSLPLNTARFSSQPVQEMSVDIELSTRRPLKSIYSPTHSLEIKRHGAAKATAAFEAENVVPDSDLALYFAPEKDEIGLNLLTHRSGDEDGYFLLLASPGMDVKEKSVVRKDVIFVLDTSGSMAGKKLEQAKKALEFCVENLNDGDRFEIVRFSTEAEPLFYGLTSASADHRERATEFIRNLKPIGSTAIDDALKKALSLAPADNNDNKRIFVLVFLTDGKPTIGITDEDAIVSNVKKYSDATTPRIFCFGIGTDVNTHLLDRITDETRAYSQYVLPEEDLEVKVSDFFTKIKEPVLANPSLKFTGDVRVTKLYPSPLPDLFKGQQMVLVGRYSGRGDSAVVIEGSVNGRNRRFDHEVTFPKRESENEFIPRLWATRRVGYLLDEIRLNGENKELKDEITELARRYGIVTPYTAYLITEDEQRREVALQSQSLPSLARDKQLFGAYLQSYEDLQRNNSGDASVGLARAGRLLKDASAPSVALAAGNTAVSRGYATAPQSVASPATGLPGQSNSRSDSLGLTSTAESAQWTRQAGGRSFYLNDDVWIEAGISGMTNAPRKKIVFGSSEYFELQRKYPESLPWLSLGQNVQFVLNGEVYEIHE